MAEQKKMKLNYKLTFLIGFGFMARRYFSAAVRQNFRPDAQPFG